ncbi:Endoglucanase [Quillaja saponaria]|uniref:Endoglucanase n=1 Tax=Quillaja saponaria TaxID=32244 RepID=A0AAD7P7H0_QUISA|nr:Endoglucanase [Quillaja saponaria]
MVNKMMIGKVLLFVYVFAFFASQTTSLPLSTNKRWIVDANSGERVKLACVNWVTHLQPMLAEGLNKQPLSNIASQIANRGFNCVRFTWATYMFTRYANHTVGDTIDNLNIPKMKAEIAKHNPFVLTMTHLQAYDAVIDELGAHGIMVSLDNHVGKPGWCCSQDDDNGFFGDRHYDPEEWLQALAFIANHYKEKPQVIAMSLRNELRGPHQNEHDWYKYVSEGARTIHKNNPKLLVLISGLNYDSDFSYLKKKPLDLEDLGNKLVYETHLYSFTAGAGSTWTAQPVNRVCATTIQGLKDRAGFLMGGDNPTPLFMSEFGVNLEGSSQSDNLWLTCILAYIAGTDMDWALWTLQSSYYLREHHVDGDETFSILDHEWKHLRNKEFPQRFQLVQKKNQEPISALPKSHKMLHPLSGHCFKANNKNELELSDCLKGAGRWSFDGDGSPLRLMGTATCLKVIGDGAPAILSDDCLSQQSSWRRVSLAGLHLAARDENGNQFCLEKVGDQILTKKCICIEDDSKCMDNPQSQWFQLVPTNMD